MVLFLTTTLVVSTLGMLGIVGLKRYELATGRLFLAGLRPGLRHFFRRTFFWFERVLPSLIAHEAGRLWRAGRAVVRTAAAQGLLFAEQTLERGLSALRQATSHAPARPGDASPFLREVAEHKKKLQEERIEE